MAKLEKAEKRILADVWPHIDFSELVQIDDDSNFIRTIGLNTQSEATPLVLLHGMGSGVGLWSLNLKSLSKTRPIYAIDLLGFGRSSRSKFSKDAMEAEAEFVRSIDDWRRKMGLEKFILLGHSFGGYLAAAYALQYPQYLSHLILVDPWGFVDHTTREDQRASLPAWAKVVANVLLNFNPFAPLRLAGPLGPYFVKRFHSSLAESFASSPGGDAFPDYIRHCVAGRPSGEAAFKAMTVPLIWAQYPMIKRIGDLDPELGITMLHGEWSWMDSSIGYDVKYLRRKSHVDVHVLDAGHHVYADAAAHFNWLVNNMCQQVDTRRADPDHPAALSMNISKRKTKSTLNEELTDQDPAKEHDTTENHSKSRLSLKQNIEPGMASEVNSESKPSSEQDSKSGRSLELDIESPEHKIVDSAR